MRRTVGGALRHEHAFQPASAGGWTRASLADENIVSFVAALAPRQLLLAHNSFGKKLRASMEPRLKTAAPRTELLTGR